MRFGMELGAYLAVAFVAHALLRSRSRLAPIIACVALVLGIIAITIGRLPEDILWAAELMSKEWIGLVYGVIGGLATGAASAAVRKLSSAVIRGTVTGVVAFTGLAITLNWRTESIFLPFEPLAEGRWKGDVCLQTSGVTCGPASLATCLRALGVSATEYDLTLAANTSQNGVYLSDLARVARRYGVNAVFHKGEPISEIPLPAIAATTIAGVPHDVAIIQKDGRRFIADPLGGYQPLDSKNYEWLGVFLSLSRR